MYFNQLIDHIFLDYDFAILHLNIMSFLDLRNFYCPFLIDSIEQLMIFDLDF